MYFCETKYLTTTEITISINPILEKQPKGSTQMFSQAQNTTQGFSLPHLYKPGTFKMGTTSKNKNIDTNLGKGDLKVQLTWFYKYNFSILPSKIFKTVFHTIFLWCLPSGYILHLLSMLPQSIVAGLGSGCTLEFFVWGEGGVHMTCYPPSEILISVPGGGTWAPYLKNSPDEPSVQPRLMATSLDELASEWGHNSSGFWKRNFECLYIYILSHYFKILCNLYLECISAY